MKWDFQQTGDDGALSLSGEITVRHVSELRPVLVRSLASVNRLALRLEDVGEVDLSFLQLLCSAHKTSSLLMKELTLVAPAPSFTRAVREAGYVSHSRCTQGKAEGCFWTSEEMAPCGSSDSGVVATGESAS
jgi:ABC-type transporter Mla MlaB component